MAFEIRRLELAAQANNNNNNDGRANSEERHLSKADLKRFPVFRKGDCPESFMMMFERACEDFEVRESERMIVLRSQISGGLAEIYAEMPLELIKNYDEFKKLVFARYGINAEQLRQRFRSLNKKPEESYSQFGANLTRYLDKWIQQEGVETVQDLKNIIGLEQFYSHLPSELRYLVRDKKPKNLQEAGQALSLIHI